MDVVNVENKLSFAQKAKIIIQKIEEYNKINKEIKRYGDIFNTFSFYYELKEPILFFELKSTDYAENDFSATSLATEQWIEINVEKDKEVNWLIKTINKFLEKSKSVMQKAREISKPHVGILVYDEFTDSYYLNPTTGPILLKSKEVLKEISSTRIDIFNIFINLRSVAVEEDRAVEIFGLNLEEVIVKIDDSLKSINMLAKKIMKIEGIPRYISSIEVDDKIMYYNGYATIDFGLAAEDKNKVNEVSLEANINEIEELEKIYIQIRKDEEVSKIMANLGRSLVSKNNPKLYVQNSITGLWELSYEGRKTIKNLNIIDFINTDISEMDFDIN